MRKRAISALVAAILCLNLLLPVRVAAVTDDDVIRAVLVVFRCREGTYDSVNRNDNGAVSVGKLQWHGMRALELLKEICAADPSNALAILGQGLFQEITTTGRDAWDNRIVTAEEGALISRLLGIAASTRVQDATAKKDISNYISHARTYKINSAEAMVYYCDIENQYGPGGAADLVSRVKAWLGKSTIDNVDEFHGALVKVTANYLERRNWTYSYCANLDWKNLGADASMIAVPSTPVIPVNVDVSPPRITSARLVPLDGERFQVEVGATDNKNVTDCRVQIGTDADAEREWAAYARVSGNLWTLSVNTAKFSPAAKKFYVTVTVSDASGNATSTRLELTHEKLTDPSKPCEHSFVTVSETPASCTEAGSRVERCEICGQTREIELNPALGHQSTPEGDRCAVCGAALREQPEDESLSGILEQAAKKIVDSYQKQIEQ